MKKIVTVLGARPQFIKASVVSHALAALADDICELVVHTGQHFDANMSDVFFDELGMRPPAYSMAIHSMPHGAMTGRMLTEIEQVLLHERPAAVLVYGDTNSTLAGALAAAKLHIPVAHVEAGLRSFNLTMPEEINRMLTDRISRWLFTPNEVAKAHLIQEGVSATQIIEVGDVMYDVALHHGARVNSQGRVLKRLALQANTYVLVTVHRAENTDTTQRLLAIADALEMISGKIPVVWPLHPRTRQALSDLGRLQQLATVVQLIEPVSYLDMMQLEKYAAVIATDSGGVQKEAFFCEVPCITLRNETEWTELISAGWNQLVPPHNAEDIAQAVNAALGRRGQPIKPYGDGDAAIRIAQRLQLDLQR